MALGKAVVAGSAEVERLADEEGNRFSETDEKFMRTVFANDGTGLSARQGKIEVLLFSNEKITAGSGCVVCAHTHAARLHARVRACLELTFGFCDVSVPRVSRHIVASRAERLVTRVCVGVSCLAQAGQFSQFPGRGSYCQAGRLGQGSGEWSFAQGGGREKNFRSGIKVAGF